MNSEAIFGFFLRKSLQFAEKSRFKTGASLIVSAHFRFKTTFFDLIGKGLKCVAPHKSSVISVTPGSGDAVRLNPNSSPMASIDAFSLRTSPKICFTPIERA